MGESWKYVFLGVLFSFVVERCEKGLGLLKHTLLKGNQEKN